MRADLPSQTRRRLERLAVKGEGGQWSMDDIDWSRGPQVPRWLPKRLYRSIISQFQYGERMTVELCRRLADELGDPVLKRCVELQATDEIRHADVYFRYLESIGGAVDPDPALAESLSAALHHPGPPVLPMLAYHVILEGEAMRTLEDLRGTFTCPLFTEISRRTARDEARHIAFGRLYLKSVIPNMTSAEKAGLMRDLREIWDACADGILSGYRVPGFFSRALRRRWAADGWQHHAEALADVGLTEATGP